MPYGFKQYRILITMKVVKVDSIDLNMLQRVLASEKITEAQKTQFIRQNQTQIEKVIKMQVTPTEFKGLMKNRPLRKFKPLRNSFTKRGDKALLAQTLEIQPNEVEDYIKEVRADMSEVEDLNFLPKDKMDALKTYIYRHGSKDDIVSFLDYELHCAKDVLRTLYSTLEYHTGGVADYFIRPIHRMDNKTLVKLYNVVNKHITASKETGNISEEEQLKTAKWALLRIYELQNNSKFVNAVKTYKILSQ